jgi:hypothetical protein
MAQVFDKETSTDSGQKDKIIDFKKEVQPCIDALFSGKYDLIVKPAEDSEDSPCNLSLILRVVLIELNNLNKILKDKECVCNK